MKTVLAIVMSVVFTACETTAIHQGSHKARITFYNAHEDKFGARTACGGKARQGRTIAAESGFSFGTWVRLPALRRWLGCDKFVVEDRGTAVERRKASQGRMPVFDVFIGNRRLYKQLANLPPIITDYE
jgi:hypothetical protein